MRYDIDVENKQYSSAYELSYEYEYHSAVHIDYDVWIWFYGARAVKIVDCSVCYMHACTACMLYCFVVWYVRNNYTSERSQNASTSRSSCFPQRHHSALNQHSLPLSTLAFRSTYYRLWSWITRSYTKTNGWMVQEKWQTQQAEILRVGTFACYYYNRSCMMIVFLRVCVYSH